MLPISVLVPTLRRPEGLERTLRSIFAQHGVHELVQDIVVVDNSPEGSARRFVDRLRKLAPTTILYVHEPSPGVATARNAGLGACHGAYVAFLDDDQEAPPNWLVALYRTHRALKADVTFGPIEAVLAGERDWSWEFLVRFFSRTGPSKPGPTDVAYGCSNALMTRMTALAATAPFDAQCDEVGGEDLRLFARVRDNEGVFGWAADAWVVEHVLEHRSNLSYALVRAFAYGQTPLRLCLNRRDWLGVVRWMAIGIGQATLFGAAAGLLWVAKRPARAEMANRASRALGKVAWWWTPRFYGAVEVARTEPELAGAA